MPKINVQLPSILFKPVSVGSPECLNFGHFEISGIYPSHYSVDLEIFHVKGTINNIRGPYL